MNYVFAYPLESFHRDATDQEILDAWHHDEGVKRYTLEQFSDMLNSENFAHGHYWIRFIDDMKGFFPISYLHRDDLESIGYDASKVSDSDMETMASKLGSDYTDQLFWDSLHIIADIVGVPEIDQEDADETDEIVNTQTN